MNFININFHTNFFCIQISCPPLIIIKLHDYICNSHVTKLINNVYICNYCCQSLRYLVPSPALPLIILIYYLHLCNRNSSHFT
jgi:hypothetical protein